jgi:RNA recognition motif-containing protein
VKKLFVGNLPYEANEQQLRNWFAKSGFNTLSATVERDRFTDSSRGFGYVEIAGEQADAAIRACNGRDFQGRTLVISHARMPAGTAGSPAQPVFSRGRSLTDRTL